MTLRLTFGGTRRRNWMRACHRRRPVPRRASTAAARASRPDVRPAVPVGGIHFSTLRVRLARSALGAARRGFWQVGGGPGREGGTYCNSHLFTPITDV